MSTEPTVLLSAINNFAFYPRIAPSLPSRSMHSRRSVE